MHWYQILVMLYLIVTTSRGLMWSHDEATDKADFFIFSSLRLSASAALILLLNEGGFWR